MFDDSDYEVKNVDGIEYRLESINCKRCGAIHPLVEGMGDGALYWCGNELLQISIGDEVNIDYGC